MQMTYVRNDADPAFTHYKALSFLWVGSEWLFGLLAETAAFVRTNMVSRVRLVLEHAKRRRQGR